MDEMLGLGGILRRQVKFILKIVTNECLNVTKEDTILEGSKNLMIHLETMRNNGLQFCSHGFLSALQHRGYCSNRGLYVDSAFSEGELQ